MYLASAINQSFQFQLFYLNTKKYLWYVEISYVSLFRMVHDQKVWELLLCTISDIRHFSLHHHHVPVLIGGEFNWGKCIFPIKPDSHCELLHRTKFPISLQLHISLSPEQHLTPSCTNCLHVTSSKNATTYWKIKCLFNTKVRDPCLLNMSFMLHTSLWTCFVWFIVVYKSPVCCHCKSTIFACV